MAAEPSVSPADTIRHLLEVAQDFLALEYPTGTDHLADAEANRLECALVAALDAFPALLAVGERDKADIEAAESLAAAHEGRAQSLAAEVERLEQALRESNDLRRVQRHSHDALSRRNVELTEAGERDRRQIAQLTEALAFYADEDNYFETYPDETQVPVQCPALADEGARARAVLADEEDAANG